MAHYVMADIHGEGERFHGMLKKIDFSDADNLYILGDLVDRGPDGIALIQEIMAMPNVTMLLGNHEYMMLQYFSPDATEADYRRWNKNGNGPTLAVFQKCSPDRQEEILNFLRARPSHLQLDVNGKGFYLIHGFPAGDVEDEVWNRPTLQTPNPVADCQLIIGHTPVLELIQLENKQEAYTQELERRGEHLKILHTPGFIDIDCCCGYDMPGKALACMRLEDMAEFYQC